MSGMITIAKKEFGDILSNKIVIITVSIFLILAILNIYDIYNGLKANIIINFYGAINGSVLFALIGYGSILGVIIGVTSISNERRTNALSVLVSKPLYRDTIINGKLIGSLCALTCIFGFVMAIYTLALLLICGNTVTSIMPDYMLRLPVVLAIAVIYVMIFLSIAMFVSIMVKDYAVSVIMSVTIWSLLLFIQNITFASGIAALIPGSNSNTVSFIAGFSPYAILSSNSMSIFFESADVMAGLGSMTFNIIQLLVYLIVSVMVCYIAFLKRDIT